MNYESIFNYVMYLDHFMNYESIFNYVMYLDLFMNYESIFNYAMYSSNSNSNSFESSYDPWVTSFHTFSDPLPSYEFNNNIGYNW